MSRLLLNDGWRFREKFNPFAEMGRTTIPYRDVTLPHDAMIDRKRDPAVRRGEWSAYFPGGTYEYSRTFELPADTAGKRVVFEFEGVYRDAIVHVNGDFAGQWAYGYSRFFIDATHLIKPGQSNEIHVEARNHQDARWYSGAGIYRDVWMHVTERVHIAAEGVRVTTPDIGADRAVVEIEVKLVNDSADLVTVELVSEVTGASGNHVAADSSKVTVLAGSSAIARHRVYVPQPDLWSVDSPHLYTASTELRSGAAPAEVRQTTFGIRKLQLDPLQGLRINGGTVKLRGACIHHDNGIVGSATFAHSEERRVRILKEAGFNAIRSAHNPLSRAMLDACDRLGMLVMDEAFDSWTVGKTDFGYQINFAEWWERDLEALVAKDYNHPSVIFYAIGNEIPETGTAMGGVWSRRLAEKVRSLDGTRFITNAINGMLAVMPDVIAMMEQRPEAGVTEGAGINTMMTDVGDMMNMIGTSEPVTEKTAESFGLLDVAGMNYLEARYEQDRELFPNRIIVGTETFPTRIDKLWRLVLDNNHVLGDFTWTGWDYLGEVGIGRVKYAEDAAGGDAFSGEYPWIAARCADIDLIGHRRPQSYYREIVFGLRAEPFIAVRRPSRHGQTALPGPWAWSDVVSSWSWDGFDGKPVVVEVYSDAEEIELLVNGRSIGRAAAGEEHRFRCEFETEYEAGTITAIAFTEGKETGRCVLVSAGDSLFVRAAADKSRVTEGELVYVDIALADAAGSVGTADRDVTLTIDGPATLQGFGSANPATDVPYSLPTQRTFDGRALAAVRAVGEGRIRVRASAEGCASTVVEIEVGNATIGGGEK